MKPKTEADHVVASLLTLSKAALPLWSVEWHIPLRLPNTMRSPPTESLSEGQLLPALDLEA